MKKEKRIVIRYCLSFCIPFVMYMIIGILLKLYPLSDHTILYSDNNSQFVSFFNYYKSLFSSNSDFFYTFSKNLGGDMIGFSAYYLHNPLLVLLFLFPYEYMPLGIFLMEIIMLSLASLSFMHYLEKVYGKGNLLFSTCYGMMGYVLAYFTLPMYFCNIVLLPLVIIEFNLMMKDERINNKLCYIVLLALSIYCNYYIGYMLCIFLSLYFVYYVGCSENYKKIKTFVGTSILGVMLFGFNLIPVVLSLRDQKDMVNSSIFSIGRMFKLIHIYKNALPGTYNFDSPNGSMPYIYVGLLPIVCAIYVFISKKVRSSEKVSSLIIILLFGLSFYIKPINTIWHAFNEPVGFPHRFAFYFSFIILSIGYRGYLLIDGELKDKIQQEIRRMAVVTIVIMISFMELFYNAYHSLKVDVTYAATESDYMSFYEKMGPIIDYIKSEEGEESLYRLEKDIQYTMVDSMAFNYAGLTHNSSCEKARVKDFMGKMGFRNQGIWAFYNQGSTSFADSFLGVKYFISRFDTTDKPYENIKSDEDIFIFKNPYSLGFASIMNTQDVLKVSEKIDAQSDKYLAKAGSGISNTGNTFEFQNDIASCYGITNDIFEEADISEIRVSGNIVLSDRFMSHIDDNQVDITKNDSDSNNGYIEFDVNVKESGKTLYMYFLAPKMQGARIYVNDIDWDDYFSDWRWAVERVGTFKEGDKVTIRIEATSDMLTLDDYQLYYENPVALGEWYEKANELGANSVSLKKVSSSHLVGNYNASADGTLVFSIPDEKGWHIKVDGKSVKHNRVLYVLMGLETTAGEHTIELRYIPEGLVIGILVSVIALAICILLYIKEGKHEK